MSISSIIGNYKLRKSRDGVTEEKKEIVEDQKESLENVKNHVLPQQEQQEPRKRGRPSKSPSRISLPQMITGSMNSAPKSANAAEAANKLRSGQYLSEIHMYKIHFSFIVGPALEGIALTSCSPEELKNLSEACETAIENYIMSHSTPLLLDDIISTGEKVITGIALSSDNPNVKQLSFLQNFSKNCKEDPILGLELKLTACKMAKYMPRSRPARLLSNLARVGFKTYTENQAAAQFDERIASNEKFKDF